MQHRFDNSESAGHVEGSEGRRGKPGFEFVKEKVPRGIFDSRVNKRGTQVFFWERGNGKAKDTGNIGLSQGRHVEKENLRFGVIYGETRGCGKKNL